MGRRLGKINLTYTLYSLAGVVATVIGAAAGCKWA